MDLKFQMSDKQRAINNAKSDGLARAAISNSFAADSADEEKRSAHCLGVYNATGSTTATTSSARFHRPLEVVFRSARLVIERLVAFDR